MKGQSKQPGLDRDEYPPAISRRAEQVLACGESIRATIAVRVLLWAISAGLSRMAPWFGSL